MRSLHMPAENTPNNPQPTCPEKEPRSYPPEGTGTLVVRVCASDKDKVVRGARVNTTSVIIGVQGAGQQGPTGVTNDSGELVLEVPAGDWEVKATAFGTTASKAVSVPPKCETCVQVDLPISLCVKVSAVTDADKKGDPGFYSAGTIIAAEVEHSVSDVKFEWTVSGGSILEDCAKATGPTIHIDTSSARGPVNIRVTM